MLRKLFYFFLVFQVLFVFGQKMHKYPLAPKDSTFDVYFDTTVYDPFQWMEDPTDSRLNEWLEAQKVITKKQDKQQLHLDVLRAQIGSLYNKVNRKTTEDYIELENNDKYEFKYDYKTYNQSANLLFRKKGNGNYRRLVTIRDFESDKKDNVAITNKYINEERDLAAIEMSHSGSDWREVYFFDLRTGIQLQDTLQYLRATSSLIWFENGLYYDRYKKPKAGRGLLDKATGQTLYYHKIGAPQSEDVSIYQNPDTTGTNNFHYSQRDSSHFFLHYYMYSRGQTYRAIAHATPNDNGHFFPKNFLMFPNDDAVNFNIEEVFGDTVILSTDWNSPNGRVLMADINQMNKLIEIVPQTEHTLRFVNRLGANKIACIYRNDAQNVVNIFNLKGELLKTIDFPHGKKVNSFRQEDPLATYMNFNISSFYHPHLWYQLSLEDLSFKPIESVSVPYDHTQLETRYVKYKSKDGTEIPMYITCLKDTKLNGKNPTLLYGYGGYGITVEPSFDQSKALLFLHGGILAVPNVRGGGAEGSDWALAGRRLNKQNAIDDFIAAAEYLIAENYTAPDKLAIGGGSHGGMLVGAAMTQRPELYKAVIGEAGPYDMLRKEHFTGASTSLNIKEYGVLENQADFVNLKSYSPLQSVKEGVKYPNTLLITGDTDDRVPPLHSYKFLATLQEKASAESLYHVYIVPGAGHGGALTPNDWADKKLFEYYFLFDQLGLKFW